MIRNSRWPPCPYMVKTIQKTSFPEPPGGLGCYFAGSICCTSLHKIAKIIPVGSLVGWLFWVKRPFETVFQSMSGRLPKRGRQRRERIDESKNVQTTRTYCKCSRPLPYCNFTLKCLIPFITTDSDLPWEH